MEIVDQSITLNLPYDLSDETWQKVAVVYQQMEGWLGVNDVPWWFGNEDDPRHISASVEPSGLLIEGRLESEVWIQWIDTLCARLSELLGFEVSDAEG